MANKGHPQELKRLRREKKPKLSCLEDVLAELCSAQPSGRKQASVDGCVLMYYFPRGVPFVS